MPDKVNFCRSKSVKNIFTPADSTVATLEPRSHSQPPLALVAKNSQKFSLVAKFIARVVVALLSHSLWRKSIEKALLLKKKIIREFKHAIHEKFFTIWYNCNIH